MDVFKPKAAKVAKQDNSAAIKTANEQKAAAEEQARKADEERKATQNDIIEKNKTRRKQAFQRFSLLLVDDNGQSTFGG